MNRPEYLSYFALYEREGVEKAKGEYFNDLNKYCDKLEESVKVLENALDLACAFGECNYGHASAKSLKESFMKEAAQLLGGEE